MRPLEITLGALLLYFMFVASVLTWLIWHSERRHRRTIGQLKQMRRDKEQLEQEYAEIAYLEQLWRREACR